MKSIGIDIGKRRCIVCTMNRNGTVLEETGYENTYAAATAFARKARMEYGKCQAVCESTGNLWIKTYEAFEDRGIPIELANPMKVGAIAEASVKTGIHRSYRTRLVAVSATLILSTRTMCAATILRTTLEFFSFLYAFPGSSCFVAFITRSYERGSLLVSILWICSERTFSLCYRWEHTTFELA